MRCYYGDDIEDNRRWEGNIKMDLKEIGVDVMNWIYLFQDLNYRIFLVNRALNIPFS